MPAGRQLPVVFGVALTVLALDVVTKLIVVRTLSGHPPIRLLDGFLTLLLLRNSGAAFSIGTSMTIVFTAIAAAVIVYILRAARRLRSLPWAITLGLLLGGATGNLADRIFRSPGLFRGDVVDWIELPHWPVFNLADSAIVCGGVLAVLLALRGVRLDGSREGADDAAERAIRPAGDQAGRRSGRRRSGRTRSGRTRSGRTRSSRHALKLRRRMGMTAPGQRYLPVPEGLDGERLDTALARMFGLSRSRAAELISDGLVLVGGHPAAKSDRVAAGEPLEVDAARPASGNAAAGRGGPERRLRGRRHPGGG